MRTCFVPRLKQPIACARVHSIALEPHDHALAHAIQGRPQHEHLHEPSRNIYNRA